MSETSALCALHPGTPAEFTCARCGTFGCDACRSPADSTFCRSCKAPIPAILLGELSVDGLIRGALQGLRGNLRALGLLTVIWFVASHVANYMLMYVLMYAAVDVAQEFSLLVTLLPAFIIIIFFDASVSWWMGMSFLERRGRSLSRALLAGPSTVSRLAPFWILTVATLLTSCSWFGLVGFLLPTAWTLALPAAVLDRFRGWAALGHAWVLTQGHRRSLLLLFLAYYILARVQSFAIMKGGLYLPLSSPESLEVVNFFLPLADLPLRILLVTTFTLFYLRRTQGAVDASMAVETVPGADRR